MKTKSLCRYAKYYAIYVLLFLWSMAFANAQCPTINNASPLVCDASGFNFNDLNAFVTDNGGGIAWYSAATGGIRYGSTQLVMEGTYYVDNSSGNCGSRSAIVVDFQVNKSGQNLDAIFCSNENPTIQTYINQAIQSSIPLGGSVEIFYDFNLTNLANVTDAIPLGGRNYFIVFMDSSNCKGQIENGTTATFLAPNDPMPPSSQLFCTISNPTVADLNPGTSDPVSWYLALDAFGDPIPPALSTSTPLVDGNTYYVQADDIFCDSNPMPVMVTINSPNIPGASSSLNYCEDNVPTNDFDLYNELGGSADTNGIWSGPLATANGYLGTVNISTLTTPGVYVFTYMVPTNGLCPSGSANVTITIYENFTSGTASTNNPVSFCESTAPTSFDLFSLLDNEDPNGQWTQGTSSSDPLVNSSIDFSGYPPNTYNFTYTQNLLPNVCAEESTTVQVVILQDPNAGNAVNQSFCENDLAANPPFNLFDALDGSQDNNSGTWTDANNIVISDPLNLDITGFTVSGSPYSFNYTIDNGSCSDTETISITILPAPESGTINAPAEFCEGAAPTSFDLFTLLEGEDQTGTWHVGNDNTGAVITNPIDLSALTANSYNFTFDVNAIGSCDDVLVTVSVIINPIPNTGTPNNPPPFCENDPALANTAFDLFSILSGPVDAGGTWSDDSSSNALTANNVNLSALTIGTYNYTYTITDVNGCTSSTTVAITIQDAPESGTVNAPAEFCEGAAPMSFDLFTLLEGEDQTGTWHVGNDNTGAVIINPIDLSALTANTYNFTFDVNAIGSCDDILVTVSVIINPIPNTGTPNNPPPFCENDPALANTAFDLFTIINGPVDAGGTWSDGSSSNALTANNVNLSTLTIGSYNYTYTITDVNGCTSSTTVAITIQDAPESGTVNAPAEFCEGVAPASFDLFTLLEGEDQTGTWHVGNDNTGAVVSNPIDLSVLTANTYNFTFDVNAIGSCDDVLVTVTVIINPAPPPPTGPSTQEFCDSASIADLSVTGTGIQWYDVATGGTAIAGTTAIVIGQSYYATQVNSFGCESTTRLQITPTIYQSPNAGADASTLVCVADGPTDLFQFLGTNAQTGGTWSNGFSGVFDPAVDAPGDYVYTVTGTSPCVPTASAQVSVTVDDIVAPTVVNANPEFCLSDNPTINDLNNSLTATGTITWYADASLITPLNDSDVLVDGEDYFATQTNNSGCESSQNVQVTVTVNDEPTPTLKNSNLALCINDSPTIEDLTNNINEYNPNLDNVSWYDSATGGSLYANTDNLNPGVTYYVAINNTSTGCESALRLAVLPDLTSCGKLILPDGFSPNGDSVNDIFDYNNMDILYPNFYIEIFNRYGNIVYKGNANTPRFDGTSNQSGTLGNGKLPVGVYFYVFSYNDGVNKPEQGRLYLSR